MLGLHDYLGQGTSFVGMLNAFWEPKPYVTVEDFKKFSNFTVPLARFTRRVYTLAEALDVDIEPAHYGNEPTEKSIAVWKIAGTSFKGEWGPRDVHIGKNFHLGRITVDLFKLKAPREYKLVVTVAPESLFNPVTRTIIEGPKAIKGETYFENDWNFWVFPAGDPEEHDMREATPGVDPSNCPQSRNPQALITSSWDEAEPALAAGGRVLLIARDLDWNSPPLVATPVFWNRQMNPAWGRMLGLWIKRDATDPADSKFVMLGCCPTSSRFARRWAQILQRVRAVNLDRMPVELEPVVWAIDDWNRNYKLGVLFELAVGDGRLLVSGFDVVSP